ncbi:MAG TPA: histidine kinase dimerization/phospho-acceptor domain-containing protein, partial [Geobacteraceae bacterium]|nr:histidine kinase dimerization/phospho-acceptor domain-containing protein [Geobacteraceae bacterium]
MSKHLLCKATKQPFASQISPDGRIDERLLEQLAFNEKMAELGKLAAGMVHELNTPLSVIVSAAQMILREDNLSDFSREMVERIDQ